MLARRMALLRRQVCRLSRQFEALSDKLNSVVVRNFYMKPVLHTLIAGKAAIGGGNSVCVRPIPDWQKGIAGFMTKSANGESSCKPDCDDIDPDAGPSSAMPKHTAAEQNGAAASEIANGNGRVSNEEEAADEEEAEEAVSISKKKKIAR